MNKNKYTKISLVLLAVLLIVLVGKLIYENMTVTYYVDTANTCEWIDGEMATTSLVYTNGSDIETKQIKRKDTKSYEENAASNSICTSTDKSVIE